MTAVSLNILFSLAFISIEFSFLHGSYFILSWILSHSPQLFHEIFCSSWHLFQSDFYFFTVISGKHFFDKSKPLPHKPLQNVLKKLTSIFMQLSQEFKVGSMHRWRSIHWWGADASYLLVQVINVQQDGMHGDSNNDGGGQWKSTIILFRIQL